MFHRLCVCASLLVSLVATGSVRSEEPQGVPPIKAVYFVPSDCEPIAGREERLGRVMRHVQEFYRRGMNECGFGNKTFALEFDSPDSLKLYTVRGAKKQSEYGRNDAGAVRREVVAALREQYQIDADREVIIIFQVLLRWDGDKATEVGPYVGGGSHLSGTAWVYDDKLLDAANLPNKDAGGYYNGRCSVGQFNTHYIGGVAHELGHALSLPHDCERDAEQSEKGHSLMGGGNHTYGKEERGEGRGAFLSMASAMRLDRVRALAGDKAKRSPRTQYDFTELRAELEKSGTPQKEKLVLRGQVAATPPLLGLIAFCDNSNINSDYDAKTWTTRPDKDGRFEIVIDEWVSAPYQLRLQGVHETGDVSSLSIDYSVDANGRPDVAAINLLVPVARLKKAFLSGDAAALEREVAASKDAPNDVKQELQRRAVHLAKLRQSDAPLIVASEVTAENRLDLTQAVSAKATTGWGPPRCGTVPEDVFIQVGGSFFESGLYAHAPSLYRFALGKKWSRFDVKCGLQDGHSGSVVFVIRGDDKELFRSEKVTPAKLVPATIDVSGIESLEMIVEDGGDGTNSDWGVWIEPTLTR
ncbi:MAG: NPCBM/NEW2 domain-containing protein [Thermoguttaceae bacterium]